MPFFLAKKQKGTANPALFIKRQSFQNRELKCGCGDVKSNLQFSLVMRKTRSFLNIALTALILPSCSVSERGSESSSTPSGSQALSSMQTEAESGGLSSHPSSVSTRSSRSSYERNPFSIRSSSAYYTVSIYQCYLLSAQGAYGNPRYDFSVIVQAGEPLYATVEECHALLDSCNESYRTNGGIYGLYGFYSDVTCKRDIPYSFKVTSDMNAYYYCK